MTTTSLFTDALPLDPETEVVLLDDWVTLLPLLDKPPLLECCHLPCVLPQTEAPPAGTSAGHVRCASDARNRGSDRSAASASSGVAPAMLSRVAQDILLRHSLFPCSPGSHKNHSETPVAAAGPHELKASWCRAGSWTAACTSSTWPWTTAISFRSF